MSSGTPLFLASLFVAIAQGLAAEQASFAIVVDSKPVISEADLVEYHYAEHALVIRSEALSRLPQLKLSGVPFKVIAKGETIYSGLFVPTISSMSYKVPTIWVGPSDTNKPTARIVIQRPQYPESHNTEGADPRFDERVRRALESTGKLKAGDIQEADFDPDLTKALEIVLEECRTIVPGITREQLTRLFMGEPGPPSAARGRYVHRRCPYIKLDVEFDVSDPDQKPMEQRLTDTVKKVSRPYLAWKNGE